ncbi:hypothetical protein, partial [Burkholderia pseudomallei]|uniref:hypothetical protein n=1 Tax=Burkholderia pseudomallei TaxID=28450 RepID=UPI001F1C4268
PLHHFKLEPLVVFRHEKTPKGQIYVQLLGFSSAGPVSSCACERRKYPVNRARLKPRETG